MILKRKKAQDLKRKVLLQILQNKTSSLKGIQNKIDQRMFPFIATTEFFKVKVVHGRDREMSRVRKCYISYVTYVHHMCITCLKCQNGQTGFSFSNWVISVFSSYPYYMDHICYKYERYIICNI